MRNLLAKFRSTYPDLARVSMHAKEDRLVAGDSDEASVTLWVDDGNWEVVTNEAHGHVDSLEEGMELMASLLRGQARTCREYRGDTRSATWIELPVEDWFESHHIALYLSPFDPDDWQLAEGEVWRQVRTVRRIAAGQRIELESWEVQAEESINAEDGTLSLLTDGLGEPDAGMKWVTRGTSFVLQCPLGWRRVRGGLGEEDVDDYSPPTQDIIFRAYAWFREGSNPNSKQPPIAVWPHSVDYENAGESDGWHQDKWVLLFSNGSSEMMGNIALYTRPDDHERRDRYIPMIDKITKRCVFVSSYGDWNCRDVAPSLAVRED